MATWRERFWPKVTLVKPSLSGLIAVDDATDSLSENHTIFPWDSVLKCGDIWRLVGDDGRVQPLTVDALRLKTASRYEDAVARRLQLRWYSAGLGRRTFNFAERYSLDWTSGFIRFFCVAYLVAVTWRISSFAVDLCDEEVTGFMPADSQWIAWIVLVVLAPLAMLSMLAPILPLACGFLFRPRAKRAHFTGEGVDVRLRDGNTRYMPWSQIKSVAMYWQEMPFLIRVQFHGDESVWFHGDGRRTWIVLRAVRQRYCPDSVERQRRIERGAPVRLMILSILSAVVAAWLAAHYPPVDGQGLTGPTAAIVCLLFGGCQATALQWGDRILRWYHRKTRKRVRHDKVQPIACQS